MKICFLMEPPRTPTVAGDILARLEASGARVDVVTEQGSLVDLEKFDFDYDLFLFKSHSPLAESLAAAAHHRGRRVLNGYEETMKVRNKTLMSLLMRRAGLPAPRTVVTDSLAKLRPVVRQAPLALRPFLDHSGRSLEFCWNEADLDALIARQPRTSTGSLVFPEPAGEGGEDGSVLGETLILAQEYPHRDPFTYRAYAVGDTVVTVRRQDASPWEEARAGVPLEADSEVVDLARRCGRLFGVELFAVDMIRTPAGYSVVDVSCFPGYRGMPGAAALVGDYILERTAAAAGGR
jgi:ribosomal protein S6--L-glutamate ligase